MIFTIFDIVNRCHDYWRGPNCTQCVQLPGCSGTLSTTTTQLSSLFVVSLVRWINPEYDIIICLKLMVDVSKVEIVSVRIQPGEDLNVILV